LKAEDGDALASAVMNQKLADCVGCQYALFFKMFEKYKKYIDHVIIWGLVWFKPDEQLYTF